MTYISNYVRSEGDPKVLRSGQSSLGSSDRLARTLGWFSFGLGMAELVAPGRLARWLGMEGSEGLIRSYGAREIGAGMLTLSVDKNLGLWSRVAGDGLDIATLMTGLREDNPKKGNVAMALLAVLGVTLLDVIGAQATAMRHSPNRGEKRSYHDRSGFPKGVEAARGAARDFSTPRDMRAAPILANEASRPFAA